jgi:hypothetical protein
MARLERSRGDQKVGDGGRHRAVQLRASRQIELPDALILATAMQVAADQILTLDRRWRGVDSRVRLREPRRASHEALRGRHRKPIRGHWTVLWL